jgi:hypothetical protein
LAAGPWLSLFYHLCEAVGDSVYNQEDTIKITKVHGTQVVKAMARRVLVERKNLKHISTSSFDTAL